MPPAVWTAAAAKPAPSRETRAAAPGPAPAGARVPRWTETRAIAAIARSLA